MSTNTTSYPVLEFDSEIQDLLELEDMDKVPTSTTPIKDINNNNNNNNDSISTTSTLYDIDHLENMSDGDNEDDISLYTTTTPPSHPLDMDHPSSLSSLPSSIIKTPSNLIADPDEFEFNFDDDDFSPIKDNNNNNSNNSNSIPNKRKFNSKYKKKNNNDNNDNIDNNSITEKNKNYAKRLESMKKSAAKQAPGTKSNEPKPSKIKKIPPSFKVIDGTKFIVDGFQYKSEDYKHYFLSHFHSDHYVGITKTWNFGPIYCSEETARLVSLKLGVDDKYLVPLKWNEYTTIEDVDVALLDANHCPGSAMLLFKIKDQHILHTGDFRFNPSMKNYPLLLNTTISSNIIVYI